MIPINQTTISDAARRYLAAGYSLTSWQNGTGKGPRSPGWDKQSIAAASDTQNIGLVHGLSRTVVLDLDDWPLTRHVFKELLGVDVDAWMEDYPTYYGNPDRRKIVFKVPARITEKLSVIKLNFPDKKKGEVFSIRGATGENPSAAQDVLPPSVHPETGMRYQWIKTPPPIHELKDAPPAFMELWENWKSYSEQAEIICGFKQPKLSEPEHKQHSYSSNGESIIDKFNQVMTIAEILTRNGYQETRQKNRFLHPGSSTGMAGTMILNGDDGKEAVFSHGSDILGADGKANDAFGAFTILEHSGDAKAAYKAAAEQMGLSYSQQHNTTAQPLPPLNTPPPEGWRAPEPIRQAAAQAGPPPATLADLFGENIMTDEDYKKIADQKYYVPQFLPKCGLFMLAGDSGEGKSWIAFMLARRVLQESKSTKVLFFDLDSGATYTKKKVHILWELFGKDRFNFISQVKGDAETLNPKLEIAANMDLTDTVVVLDSLSGFTAGNINESAKIKPFLTTCEKLRNAGATVILIHHTKKQKDDDGVSVYAGSFAIKGAMDALYMVMKDKNEITCHLEKSRGDYVARKFEINNFEGMTADDIDYLSPEEEKAAAMQRRNDWEEDNVTSIVSRAEGKDEPLLKTQLRDKIMEEMKRSRAEASKIITRLMKEKAIYEENSGMKNEKFIKVGYKNEAAPKHHEETHEEEEEGFTVYGPDGEEIPF